MALNCLVYDCIYNENGGECFAKDVKIGNRNAQTTSGTTCNSYVAASPFNNYEFAHDFLESEGSASDVKNIQCSAMNCRFNLNQDCTATKVEINSNNANCETFAP